MEAFADVNPSSEHIAKFIFDNLNESLNHDRYRLYCVSVFETDTSGLTYYGTGTPEQA